MSPRGSAFHHARICVIGLRGMPGVIGGIESFCENVYTRMAEANPSASITLLTRRGYSERQRYAFKGVAVRVLSAPRLWGVDTLMHTFWALIYARMVLAPDLVHIHGIGPAFFVPFARLLGFIVVVTHHAPDYERPKWGLGVRLLLSLGERFSAYWAQATVCVSQSVHARFLQLYPSAGARAYVIRNSAELPKKDHHARNAVLEELGLSPRRYILAVGRLDETKGFEDLICAFKTRPEGYKLVIAGSDVGNTEYFDVLSRHESDDIIFAGFRTGADLRSLYEEAALFVHPSRMEGYALVVGEALCASIPILVSDIPPHREFGLEEQCYVPVSDVPALARALSVKDYRHYHSQAAVARQRADSWDRVSQEYLSIYRPLISKRHRAKD